VIREEHRSNCPISASFRRQSNTVSDSYEKLILSTCSTPTTGPFSSASASDVSVSVASGAAMVDGVELAC
jgi:hypothetical protein